ncbi:hypothetical protein CU048_06210 [Beijerinckiaceae bacterium]|nr:hypothetical protein CU048_06210 [Beijerinckiaceae bacterium]
MVQSSTAAAKAIGAVTLELENYGASPMPANQDAARLGKTDCSLAQLAPGIETAALKELERV